MSARGRARTALLALVVSSAAAASPAAPAPGTPVPGASKPGALTAAVGARPIGGRPAIAAGRTTTATSPFENVSNRSQTPVSSRASADLGEIAAPGALVAAIGRTPSPGWIEYRVAALDAHRSPCCYGPYDDEARMQRGCALERRDDMYVGGDRDRGGDRAASAGPVELRVFLRRDAAGIDRVRAYGSDCPVDLGGASVATVGRVAASESLEVLEGLALDGSKVRDQAFVAMAHHRGAVPVLRAIVESDRPKGLRRQALFWLGQVGDDAAFEVFDELLAEPDMPKR